VLQHQLRATGDLRTWPPDHSGFFDDTLEHAVRTFQKRYGLVADGIVGRETRDALRVPVEERMQQLALNVKRWHDLPVSLGHRYILVNILSFTLQVIEGE
jgi:murein L,D-transpeptidase YcbB/YkuD